MSCACFRKQLGNAGLPWFSSFQILPLKTSEWDVGLALRMFVWCSFYLCVLLCRWLDLCLFLCQIMVLLVYMCSAYLRVVFGIRKAYLQFLRGDFKDLCIGWARRRRRHSSRHCARTVTVWRLLTRFGNGTPVQPRIICEVLLISAHKMIRPNGENAAKHLLLCASENPSRTRKLPGPTRITGGHVWFWFFVLRFLQPFQTLCPLLPYQPGSFLGGPLSLDTVSFSAPPFINPNSIGLWRS